MTEQLPVINTSHNVTATKGKSSSLLGRGLAAIQRKETGVVLSDLDSRYRQARDIYNRITDYGVETRFKVELLPTQEELLNEPLLKQLQSFYNQIKQLAEIFTIFQELANQGYGKAYFPLALMYKGGQGINDNSEKVDYYERLAFDWCFNNQTSEDLELWVDLGWMYYYGIGTEIKREQSIFWYRKAAGRDDARAQCALGCSYEENDDIEKAASWYSKSAEQDYAPALYHLGRYYAEGFIIMNVDTNYYGEVEKLFIQAAEQNYAKAQCYLGYLYEMEYVDGLDNEAVYWYLKAAEQGYSKAQLSLGNQFRYADNEIIQDFKKAAFWYYRAAEQQNVDAEIILGWMYKTGRGVEQDNEKSKYWYSRAEKQNNGMVQEELENDWHEPFSWS